MVNHITTQRQRALALQYLVGSYQDLLEEIAQHSSFAAHKRAPKTAQKFQDRCRTLYDMLMRKCDRHSIAAISADKYLRMHDMVALELLVIEYVPVTRDWMNAHMALVEKRRALEAAWNKTEDQEDDLDDVREAISRNENEHPICSYITMITVMLGQEMALRKSAASILKPGQIKPVAQEMANELRELVGLETKPIIA